MNNNGKTIVVGLTTIPGGEPANANYQLELTHWLCGNRKLCINDAYPLVADLKFTPIGAPVSTGNGQYCCEVAITGSVTYMPFNCGCKCDCDCAKQDQIFCNTCIPCSSSAVPTITGGNVVVAPTNVQPCCNITNAVALTTSINVATA